MSSRWESEYFDAFEQFVAKDLSHPGIVAPVQVLRHEDQLLAFYHYEGESLLVDEASPMRNNQILNLAQRVSGTVAFLHFNGIQLGSLAPANVLLAPDGTSRLFDFDVKDVQDAPIQTAGTSEELQSFASVLQGLCDVEAEALAQFMETAQNGRYRDPAAFGRAVEQRYDAFASITYKPIVGAMTDVGLQRQLNEDNWGWRRLSNQATVFVVADGMGGHDGGEVASALAVSTVCRIARDYEAAKSHSHEELVDQSFQSANNTIKDQAEAKGNDMGTTLVGMLLDDKKQGFLGNVGDSRAYLMRDQALHQITKDHSLVAKMVERGRITPEEARHHPHSNILLRTVGTERDVEVDVFKVQFQSGDRVLLCSDGLWGEVEDRDMESILNTYNDPRHACRELVRAAHHGGGKDNVTLIVVGIP